MAHLARLVDDLRPYVLSVAAAPLGLDVPVNSVVVHDAIDPPEVTAGDIVLGVGMPATAVAIPIIEEIAAAGAAALVMKMKLPVDPRLTDAAEAAGLALLAAPVGASWAQILTLIRTVLAQTAIEDSPEPGSGLVPSDLFGVANAIASLLDVPITIEDLQSRVIAYSGRQDEADQSRIDTILGRRVPEPILRRLHAEGVFARLKRSREPIYFRPGELVDFGREAVAVRAGDEILGSIWAAVHEPLSPERRHALTEAASLVAIHLARSRLDADVGRRVHAELVTSILEGRPDAAEAAQRLGLVGRQLRVIAIASDADGVEGDPEGLGLRLWDLAAFHLSSSFRSVATTLARGITYAVIPASGNEQLDRQHLTEPLEVLISRANSVLRVRAAAGIGRAVDLIDAPQSRREADQVLRALRVWRLDRSSASIVDVRLEVLLLRLSDLAGQEASLTGGPLQRLAEHDHGHGTRYLETLRAYFVTFGDVRQAARRLNVHTNTLRYRLRKLQELGALRLDDADQRLLLMLQLRLRELGQPPKEPRN